MKEDWAYFKLPAELKNHLNMQKGVIRNDEVDEEAAESKGGGHGRIRLARFLDRCRGISCSDTSW